MGTETINTLQQNEVDDSQDDKSAIPGAICHMKEKPEGLDRVTERKRAVELMKKCEEILNTTRDEDQIFGDYVASALRNLTDRKNNKRLKLMIQRSIIEIQETEDQSS